MKALTKDEREEIRKVINERRELALSEVNAADPGWQTRVDEKATKIAIGRLRVEKEVIALKAIEDKIRQLEVEKDQIEIQIRKKMPLNDRDRRDSCPTPKSLCESVGGIISEVRASVMAKDPAGKQVVAAQKACNDSKAKLAQCSTREDVVRLKVV